MRQVLEALKPYATRRPVKKGSILIYQGEVPRSAIVVNRGIIKAYTLTNTGSEQIVAFYTEGEPLSLTWLFSRTNISLYYYEAVEDSEIYTLPREKFHEVVNADAELKSLLFDYLVSNNSGLLLRVTSLEQQRAVEKILYTLYYLMFRYGTATDENTYSIKLKLTHNNIASLVGLTRETTATELAKLKRKGVLSYSKNEYTIDKAKLERLMGDDSFGNIKL